MNRLISAISTAINSSLTPHHSYLTIDAYLGQPSDPEQFEFALPAVFIDYAADYTNGRITIQLHALTEYGADASLTEPNLEYFLFLKALRKAVTGVRVGNVFSPLIAAQEQPVMTDAYHYHQLSFTCAYNEKLDPELSPYAQTPVEPEIVK